MNLGMPEMIFIFVLALLIFGPKKMPEIGRQVGKALGEFKRASNTIKVQLDTEVRKLEQESKPVKASLPRFPEGATEPAAEIATIAATAETPVADAPMEAAPADAAAAGAPLSAASAPVMRAAETNAAPPQEVSPTHG